MIETPTVTSTPGATRAVRAMPAPQRLFVPCGAEPRAIGAHVGEAEPVAPGIASGEPQALCPGIGRIEAAERVRILGGAEAMAVVVACETAPAPRTASPAELEKLEPGLAGIVSRDLPGGIDRIRAAGIRADRWSSPDLLQQLQQAQRKGADAVLCCAIDLDGDLPVQQTAAGRYPVELAAGVAALARMCGATRTVIALAEDTPRPLLAPIRQAADAARVRLMAMRNEYPLANPPLLVRAALGRRLAPGRLPTDACTLLLDAAAAVAVGRAVLLEQPMLRVPFGVYDRVAGIAHLLEVPVGSRLADVLRFLEIPDSRYLLSGHLLREIPARASDVIAGGELTVIASAQPQHKPAQACIRCGWCVEACPARIHPAGLLDAAQLDDPELAHRYGLDSCIDCGICSYVCPSSLPLLGAIRGLRRTRGPEK